MNDITFHVGRQGGGQLGTVRAGTLCHGHGATQHPGQTSLVLLLLLLLIPLLLFLDTNVW